MRKLLPLLLLPALAGCATGYARDWFQARPNIINPQLIRYGLDVQQSRCVGEKLGASGGWVAARLVRSGQDVRLLARGQTLAAIRARCLRVRENGEEEVVRVPASDHAEDLGPVDLVILAVKAHNLRVAAEAAAPMIGPATTIVPLLNGVPWWFTEEGEEPLRSVDPNGAIARLLPREQVLGTVVHASCRCPEPGSVIHVSGNGIILGEPSGAATPRLAEAAEAFEAAGFDVTGSAAIRRDIWYKLWGNMTMNPISALTRATCDRILDDPLIAAFIVRAMDEAAAVGARIGCAISESAEDRIQVTRRLGAFKTSMLQDAEAGRPLEVEALLGAPCEIARRVGVEVPNMDALYGLTRLYNAN